MNKFKYYFSICFSFVAFLQISNCVTMDDAIKTINGKSTLTALYCNNIGTQTELHAKGKYLDEIYSKAFWNCSKVTRINLAQNQLKELSPDTFKFNKKTEVLELHCNKLSFLSNELFKPLVNLEILTLGDNPLTAIDSVLKGGLVKLKRLAIQEIELPELNPVILKEKLPHLEKIWLDGNFIECNIYESAKAKLSTLGITSSYFSYPCSNMKKKCLTPEQKAAIVQKQQILMMIGQGVFDMKKLLEKLTENVSKNVSNI